MTSGSRDSERQERDAAHLRRRHPACACGACEAAGVVKPWPPPASPSPAEGETERCAFCDHDSLRHGLTAYCNVGGCRCIEFRASLTEDTLPVVDETTHIMASGTGLTACCGRTPFELPRTDRLAQLNVGQVNCTPPVVGDQPEETDTVNDDATMTAGSICTACKRPAYDHALVPRLGECLFRRTDGHLGLPHATSPAAGTEVREEWGVRYGPTMFGQPAEFWCETESDRAEVAGLRAREGYQIETACRTVTTTTTRWEPQP